MRGFCHAERQPDKAKLLAGSEASILQLFRSFAVLRMTSYIELRLL